MRERRGWVVAAVLLVLGAAAGAGAVREHWLPCRGSMLSGSVLRGYAYGADFSDACLRAMDDGFSFVWPDGTDPWRPEAFLGTTSALLLALAWLAVVVSHDWSRLTMVLAGLPALGTAAAGLISAVGGRSDALDTGFVWLLMSIDVLAVVAFVAIGVREVPGRATMWRVALVLLATSAVGYFPNIVDYVFMASFSDANWDTPPGTGYPTVVAVALLAAALLVVTLRPARSAPAEDLALANV